MIGRSGILQNLQEAAFLAETQMMGRLAAWRQRVVFLTLSLITLSVTGAAAPRRDFPAEVKQTARWELLNNSGLDESSLRRYAEAILRLNQGYAPAQAAEKARSLPLDEIKALATQSFEIEYLEVPESALHELGELDGRALNSLETGAPHPSPVRFTKNGKPYIRWFIHPLNEKSELEKALEQTTRGDTTKLAARKHGHFKALFTASRSLFLVDQTSGALDSIKLSLPKAEGPFRDKAYRSHQARFQATLSELIAEKANERNRLQENFLFEKEFVGIKSGELDEAQLVRSLDGFRNGKTLLPASAIMDTELGRKIARANGSSNPVEFWFKHLIQPAGDLAARLYSETGFAHNSFHSQNIMVVLSKDLRPQGVKMRDMDFDVTLEHWQSSPRYGALRKVVPPGNIAYRPSVDFSLVNGLKSKPDWLSAADYRKWVFGFFDSFGEKYAAIRGRPLPAPASRSTREAYVTAEGGTEEHYLNSTQPVPAMGRRIEHYSVLLADMENPPSWTMPPEEAAKAIQAEIEQKKLQLLSKFPEQKELIENPIQAVREMIESGDMARFAQSHQRTPGYLKQGFHELWSQDPQFLMERVSRGKPEQVAVVKNILRRIPRKDMEPLILASIERSRGQFDPEFGLIFAKDETRGMVTSYERFMDAHGKQGLEFLLKWSNSNELYTRPEIMKKFLSLADEELLSRIEKEVENERKASPAFHRLIVKIPNIDEMIHARKEGLRLQKAGIASCAKAKLLEAIHGMIRNSAIHYPIPE